MTYNAQGLMLSCSALIAAMGYQRPKVACKLLAYTRTTQEVSIRSLSSGHVRLEIATWLADEAHVIVAEWLRRQT